MKPVPFALIALGLTLFASISNAQEVAVSDSGVFKIYRYGKSRGTETFTFVTREDSTVVLSNVLEVIPAESGSDTLRKRMALVVNANDYDMRSYESHQELRGQKIHRGLVLEDTLLATYLQINDHGSGSYKVRPPGHVYLMDPGLYSLYDVLCRTLQDKTFDRRPITVYSMSVPDTIFEVTAIDLGPETIRWGARSVRARKIGITHPWMEFFLWMSPRGHMLRLEQPAYGLRVEREPPAVKRARRAPPPGG